jgi:hypothetical protein
MSSTVNNSCGATGSGSASRKASALTPLAFVFVPLAFAFLVAFELLFFAGHIVISLTIATPAQATNPAQPSSGRGRRKSEPVSFAQKRGLRAEPARPQSG